MWTKISGLLSVGCLGLSAGAFSLLAADPPQQPAPAGPGKKVAVKELHAKYPFVDVRSRLEYEVGRAAPVVLSAEADERLTVSESDLARLLDFRPRLRDARSWDDDARLRRYTLSVIHSRREDDFIDAEGFGFSRINPMLKTRNLESPTPGPLPFAKVDRPARAAEVKPEAGGTETPPGIVNTPVGLDDENPHRIPSRARLAEWHARGEVDFLNVGGLGIKPTEIIDAGTLGWNHGDKNDQRVAGFESHRFRKMPEWVDHGPLKPAPRPPDGAVVKEVEVLDPKDERYKSANERWVIERLELVSLLKHNTPAVYVSKELPAMEALGKVPTRQPSEFETVALEKLRGGEDLVIESRADTVRMVGSIRARQQCLACHQTERGALLGAFSYDLARDLAKAEK